MLSLFIMPSGFIFMPPLYDIIFGMNSFHEKGRKALANLSVMLLAISVGLPSVALSQEESATMTASTTATTTQEIVEKVMIEEMIEQEETVVEEAVVAEEVVEIIPSKPPLSVRKFEKKVKVDKKAAHSCEAETFRIDISGRESVKARGIFLRHTDVPYEIEVGGLPEGIDITFEKNQTYKYIQGSGDKDIFLTLTVHNQQGSQKGDFTVPIIYTQKGLGESSAVCQINIVNR